MIRLLTFAASCALLATPCLAAESSLSNCSLSPVALQTDATLSFEDFDQKGVTSTTSRSLGDRRCYPQAAAAAEHYLLYGPELTERQRNIATWHLGQYMALAGDEDGARKVIAATRRPYTPEPDAFDWNTYVLGSWAFLNKDRQALDQATQRLTAAPGQRNALNALVLKRFQRCFSKSYQEAYEGPACAPSR